MILIADSGSTKTEWVLLHNGAVAAEVYTQGINPYFQDQTQVSQIIRGELLTALDAAGTHPVSQVFYYGAGCSAPDKCAVIRQPLEEAFRQASVKVDHDLLAAARAACGDREGIAAILGTGSNSCLFDGTTILANQPSLGFIMGDEGSGGYIGKELLKQFLYGELDQQLHQAFYDKHQLTKEIVLDHIYKQPMPNRYAASFVPFVAEHIGHPQMEELVTGAFAVFFGRHISSYDSFQRYPLSAVGSVAAVFSEQLKKAAHMYAVNIQQILRKPMEGLIRYHLQTT
jgi:glucosamine kinase